MTALRIDSNRDGFHLELDRMHRADYFRADLSCGPMEATVEFYEMNIGALRDFFAELAAGWRGCIEREQREGLLKARRGRDRGLELVGNKRPLVGQVGEAVTGGALK